MLGRKRSLTHSASWAVPARGLASQHCFGMPKFTYGFSTQSFSLPGFSGTEEFCGERSGWEMEPRQSCEGNASPCSRSARGAGCKALWRCREAPCSFQQVLGSVSCFGSPLDQTFESPAWSIKNSRSQSVYLPSQKSTSPNQQPNQA